MMRSNGLVSNTYRFVRSPVDGTAPDVVPPVSFPAPGAISGCTSIGTCNFRINFVTD